MFDQFREIKGRIKVVLYDYHKCYFILENNRFCWYRFWNKNLKLFYPYLNLISSPHPVSLIWREFVAIEY